MTATRLDFGVTRVAMECRKPSKKRDKRVNLIFDDLLLLVATDCEYTLIAVAVAIALEVFFFGGWESDGSLLSFMATLGRLPPPTATAPMLVPAAGSVVLRTAAGSVNSGTAATGSAVGSTAGSAAGSKPTAGESCRQENGGKMHRVGKIV